MNLKLLILLPAMALVFFSCNSQSGEEGDGKKGAWSSSYKKGFISDCESQGEPDAMEDVEKFCACLADKFEKEFEPGDEEKPENEEKLDKISEGCAVEMLPEVLSRELGNIAEDIDLNANNGDWDSDEKNEVLEDCIATHEEAGTSAEDARSLCTCVVDKLEQELGIDEIKHETIDGEMKTDEFTKACGADLGIELKIELWQDGN